MRCAGARLAGPQIGAQRRRQVRAGVDDCGRAVDLAQLHRHVVDDRHVLVTKSCVTGIIGPGEDLVVAQPGDGAALGVIAIQQFRARPAGQDGSKLPCEIVRILDARIGAIAAARGR